MTNRYKGVLFGATLGFILGLGLGLGITLILGHVDTQHLYLGGIPGFILGEVSLHEAIQSIALSGVLGFSATLGAVLGMAPILGYNWYKGGAPEICCDAEAIPVVIAVANRPQTADVPG